MVKKIFRKKNWREGFMLYAPLFLWIGVIFYMSSSQGAMSNTSRFIRPLLEWLFPNTPEEIITIYHGYIRKFAHFFEYAMLGFFASRAFWLSGKEFLQKFWMIFALLIVIAVASLDEFNQSFNTLRTSSVYDVLLDISGGLVMILFLWIGKKWMKK